MWGGKSYYTHPPPLYHLSTLLFYELPFNSAAGVKMYNYNFTTYISSHFTCKSANLRLPVKQRVIKFEIRISYK